MGKSVMMSLALFFLFAGPAFSQDKAIDFTRSQKLKICSRMTIGQLIARSVASPQWESQVSNKGDTYVNVTGTIGRGNQRMSFFTQFKMHPDKGTLSIATMKFDGRPLSHDQSLEVFARLCQ